MNPSHKRKNAAAFGAFGESLGALLLMFKGYRILARQFRRPVGEVDIIARRGEFLVFVEVKAREVENAARHAISANQRSRIIRAAEAFMQERPDLEGLSIRFDALIVIRRRFPIHIVDAWRPGD